MALHSWNIAFLLIIASFLFLSASSLLLPVVAGRVLLGNVRPGTYPLWGATYLRWWLYRKLLALSPVGLLTGTPWLSPYLRLLGAKVGRDCHFASGIVNLPMFLSIEDGVSIGYGVQLQPYAVEGGRLRIAPIHIGSRCLRGHQQRVLAGASIGSGAAIAEQSLVPADQVIPSNKYWGGSSAKRGSARSLLKAMAASVDHRPGLSLCWLASLPE